MLWWAAARRPDLTMGGKMRLMLAIAVLALGLPALAQTEDQERACRSSDTPFEERIAACTALIDSGSFENMSWAHERRADAYGDNDDYEAALPDFNRAIELDPVNNVALGGRAYAYFQLSRYEEALADTTLLMEIEPDDDWNFYFHGRILAWLERYEEALAALDQAVAIQDDYYYSRYERGALHRKMGNFDLAEADYLAARDTAPFGSFIYMRLGENYLDMGDTERAAGAYRTAQINNPNQTRARMKLDELVQLDPEPSLPPLSYSPPRDGMKIRYLQVFLPFDTREEMEIAIMEIANWFSSPPKATPEAYALITRTLNLEEDDIIRIGSVLEASRNMGAVVPNGQLPTYARTFRGLFLSELETGADGPTIRMVLDEGDPADLWPLSVGNTVSGTGGFEIVCPEDFMIQAMLVGCRPGMSTVRMGSLEYSVQVVKQEQIVEPIGTYDTYVVRYRELATMEAMGRKTERVVEVNWWVSPELGFWIRRTNQRGDKIASIHAVEIVQ